jgi:hypothetical protein
MKPKFTHHKRKRKSIDALQSVVEKRVLKRIDRNSVIYPHLSRPDQVDFVGLGFYIYYSESHKLLAVSFDVVRSLFTIPIAKASELLGISISSMKVNVRNKTLESTKTMCPYCPFEVFSKISQMKKWPYYGMDESDKVAIRRFRETLILQMSNTGWDEKVVDILIKAKNIDYLLTHLPRPRIVIVNVGKEAEKKIVAKRTPVPIVSDRGGKLDWPLKMDDELPLDFWS